MLAIQANPQSIKNASPDIADTVTAFLFALVSWHIPPDNISPSVLNGNYAFVEFPAGNDDLQYKFGVFLHQLKSIVGVGEWNVVEKKFPVNVRRLLREQYNL